MNIITWKVPIDGGTRFVSTLELITFKGFPFKGVVSVINGRIENLESANASLHVQRDALVEAYKSAILVYTGYVNGDRSAGGALVYASQIIKTALAAIDAVEAENGTS